MDDADAERALGALGVTHAWLVSAERGDRTSALYAAEEAAATLAAALRAEHVRAPAVCRVLLEKAPALLRRAASLPPRTACAEAHAALLTPYLEACAAQEQLQAKHGQQHGQQQQQQHTSPSACVELFLASALATAPAQAVRFLGSARARRALRETAPQVAPRAAAPLLRTLASAPTRLGGAEAAAALSATLDEATAVHVLEACVRLPLWTAALMAESLGEAPAQPLRRLAAALRSGAAWDGVDEGGEEALAAAEALLARPTLAAQGAAAAALGAALAQAVFAATAREAPVGTLEALLEAALRLHAGPHCRVCCEAGTDGLRARAQLALREGAALIVRSEPSVLERPAAWRAVAAAITAEPASSSSGSSTSDASAAAAIELAADLASAVGAVAPAAIAEEACEALELALFQLLPTRGQAAAAVAAAQAANSPSLSPAARCRARAAAAGGAAPSRPQLVCAALASLGALACRHPSCGLAPRARAAAMRARRAATEGDELATRADEVTAKLAASHRRAPLSTLISL